MNSEGHQELHESDSEILEALARLSLHWFNDVSNWQDGTHGHGAVKCPMCKMWLNGSTQFWDHCAGKKHKRNFYRDYTVVDHRLDLVSDLVILD